VSRASDVDTVVLASRALLAVVARTINPALEQLSLPQFRVLVVLVGAGPHRVGALAERLGSVTSTFSRAVDRLEAAGWVSREPNPDSRREVIVSATDAGRELVEQVTTLRRQELTALLDTLSDEELTDVAAGFRRFAEAAGEPGVDDLLPIGG
jgi:DNA-binding MarR family transcriptional regulator